MKGYGVKRYPLSKQVADKLEALIEEGKYSVGDKIPTEVELMEIFQVSRNTIREAVQSLTSAGVLDVKQGDGTYVRSSNRFNANMTMKYEQVSIDEISEARNSMEITIADLAAKRRTEEDMAKITACFLKRKELSQVEKENTLADIQFHMAIAEACHNKIIYDLYQSLSDYMVEHIAERQADTSLEAAEIDALHEKLYLAIRQQDSEMAIICARDILSI